MSTVQLILASYRSPTKAFAQKLGEGISETRIFIWLLVSCFLSFLARLPLLSREAHLDVGGPPLDSIIGGVLVSFIFMVPLVFYALSIVLCLIFRVWFTNLKWLYFRGAFFWSLLAVSPLVLVRGVLVGIYGTSAYINMISVFVFLYFIYILICSVRTISREVNVN